MVEIYQYGSMVRFNSKLLVYNLCSSIWAMIPIRGIANTQGQPNGAPTSTPAHHHVHVRQQAVHQYVTFQQYG